MNTNSHIFHLQLELGVLQSMVKEHDTGHIITAIQVLETRVKEMEASGGQVLDSAYPDGDGYWLEK